MLDDERNMLYRFFHDAIKIKQPKFFIAENVKGILSLGTGEAIKQIVADFEKAGYLTDLQAGPSVRTAETFIAGLHGTTGGYRSIVWRCVSRVEKKKSGIDCPARTLREEDLQAAVVTAVIDAWSHKDSVLAVLEENVCSVINGGIKDKVAEVDKAIRDKQAELLEAGSDQSLIEDIGDAIINLREECQSILTEAAL